CDNGAKCSGGSADCPSNQPKPNGTACDDGNACSFNDRCQSGSCGGTPLTCTSDACNTRTCNGSSSCAVTALSGNACNDGNGWTQNDTCQNGTCVGSNPVVCGPLDQCHVAGTCNAATGRCSDPTKADGTPCD